MTLDTEAHRKFLLSILDNSRFTGNRASLREVSRLVEEVYAAIEAADVIDDNDLIDPGVVN